MDIFSLTEGKFIPQLNTVDNLFIRQLFVLAMNAGKEKKMMSVITDNMVKENENHKSESVVNICNLTPLVDKENCKNLVEEVAKYRWENLKFDFRDDFWKDNSNLLFFDYLLSSCLCYVEVYDSTNVNGKKMGGVDKFYATRNRFIAGNVAGIKDSETSKYVNYLAPVLSDYRIGSLRVLKLNRLKKGFKITQPRSAINFNKSVKVTPLFFIGAFMQSIVPLMKENIVKFTYIKDNGQERELITTLSSTIFEKYYSKDFVESVLSKVETKIDRGYMKVPELGCSKYDESGLRALNLSRIKRIELIDEIDTEYIEVDFNSIIPTFKATIEAVNNEAVISLIYQTLVGGEIGEKNINLLKSEILTFVDGRFIIGTTTFQKELHRYMLKYDMVFKGYTGKPNKFSLDIPSSFNFGVEMQ